MAHEKVYRQAGDRMAQVFKDREWGGQWVTTQTLMFAVKEEFPMFSIQAVKEACQMMILRGQITEAEEGMIFIKPLQNATRLIWTDLT